MPEYCRRTISEGHPPVICPVFEEGAILPPGLTDEQRMCLTQGRLAKDYSMGIGISPPWWRGLATDWNTFWKYQIQKYSSTPLNAASRSAMGATLSGSNKWFGGVLGPDGKIYGIPYNSTDILIISGSEAKLQWMLKGPYLNKF